MTQWKQRKSGVLIPCRTKVEAEYVSAQLLTSLMTNLSVVVVEEGGVFYVNQSVVYLTREGAIPYDVPVVSESA